MKLWSTLEFTAVHPLLEMHPPRADVMFSINSMNLTDSVHRIFISVKFWPCILHRNASLHYTGTQLHVLRWDWALFYCTVSSEQCQMHCSASWALQCIMMFLQLNWLRCRCPRLMHWTAHNFLTLLFSSWCTWCWCWCFSPDADAATSLQQHIQHPGFQRWSQITNWILSFKF